MPLLKVKVLKAHIEKDQADAFVKQKRSEVNMEVKVKAQKKKISSLNIKESGGSVEKKMNAETHG